jgi:phosphinothricin acetyltransferase
VPTESRIIRSAEVADVPAMCDIYAPLVAGTAVSFETDAPTVEEMTRRLEGTVAPDAWLVMEVDGALAGYAFSSTFRTRPAYRSTRETTVYVHAGHRGRGVGSDLLAALIGVLRDAGAHRAVAGIALPNPDSVVLHEGLGFTHVGTFTEVGRKLDRWHDVGFWELDLGPVGHPPGSPDR